MSNKDIIFNNLKFGDLILAKRELDVSRIKRGHKVGPFVVIGRKNGYLTCLYCTSSNSKGSILKICKNNFNLEKDTYVTSNVSYISLKQYISSIYYLNDLERNMLCKTLHVNGLNNYSDLEKLTLEIGDIIKIKRMHLIIDECSDGFITIPVRKDEISGTYEYDFNHKEIFSKDKKYKIVGFLSKEELIECLRLIKGTYKSSKINKEIKENHVSELRIGNLIIYRNFLYYLYFQIGDKMLSFSVSKKFISKSKSKEIVIGGDSYFANFDLKRDFDINEKNVLVVSTASDEENKVINKKRRGFN